ncbi:MAG: hypothetical protein ACRDTI_01680 [Mycobacterium sp.]
MTAAVHIESSLRQLIRHLKPISPAAALLVVALAGCSAKVQGDAVRTAPSAMERSLPTPVELSQVLNAPMQANSSLQVGGAHVLRDDKPRQEHVHALSRERPRHSA